MEDFPPEYDDIKLEQLIQVEKSLIITNNNEINLLIIQKHDLEKIIENNEKEINLVINDLKNIKNIIEDYKNSARKLIIGSEDGDISRTRYLKEKLLKYNQVIGNEYNIFTDPPNIIYQQLKEKIIPNIKRKNLDSFIKEYENICSIINDKNRFVRECEEKITNYNICLKNFIKEKDKQKRIREVVTSIPPSFEISEITQQITFLHNKIDKLTEMVNQLLHR